MSWMPSWSRTGPVALMILLIGVAAPARDLNKPAFAQWESVIRAFERQDKDKPPPAHPIVFVGSSSIRLWDLSKSFPGADMLNRGFGGSQLADSVYFADRLVVKYKPRLVVLYAGDNDIAFGKAPERVAEDFGAFVRAIHEPLPETKIIYLSIKPSLFRWGLWDKMRRANELIEKACKDNPRLTYLDVATPLFGADGKPRRELFRRDGLHLSEEGYKIWADRVRPVLK